jgi:hypothetical protein
LGPWDRLDAPREQHRQATDGQDAPMRRAQVLHTPDYEVSFSSGAQFQPMFGSGFHQLTTCRIAPNCAYLHHTATQSRRDRSCATLSEIVAVFTS